MKTASPFAAKNIFPASLLIFLVSFATAQQNFAVKNDWSADPFRQNAFVQNKGQFDGLDGNNRSIILCSVANDGVQIYLTSTGVTYKHEDVFIPGEKEKRSVTGRREEKEKPVITPHYVRLEWLNANITTSNIIWSDAVSHYYTYGDPKDPSHKSTIKANAYKKVTIQGLYPGIDVEYTVPENKSGIKYSLIVHPGADLSKVQMKYTGDVKELGEDAGGNVNITSAFGTITDHAPSTFYSGSTQTITSSFVMKKNSVGFSVGDYDHSRTLIIDPWSSVPTFTGYNGSYDVNYDFNGNVYVYGGTFPWQEIKFNSSGVQQWVYTANPFNPGWSYYYGDFAVDASSGSSYLIESINTGIGAEVIKVSNAGVQLIVFPGNVQLEEMWRIVYNNCTKQCVVVGGGVSYYNQGCVLDTNLNGIVPVNLISYNEIGHDMCLLALDNTNNAFFASTNYGNQTYNNQLMKAPANTLAPLSFMVSDGYAFQEGGNLTYINNGGGQANGYNGIAVSPNFLYTCDGSTLKKWNKTTGALIQSSVIAGTPRTCGGMDVDDCDNIYIGVQSAVNKYDVNLNLVGSTPTTNIVYDLKLGPNNKLYASGKSFVQELTISGVCNPLTLTATGTNSSCSSNSGTATVTVSGGTGPYSYSWSPSNQTNATATGLGSGTYTVTVTDAACLQHIQTATVVITNSGSLSVTTAQTNTQCSSSTNGTATVTVTGGQSPYTYSWTPSGGSNANATGLSPGTYTCYITDASGCSVTQTFTITSPPPLTLTATPTNILCNGQTNGSAQATAGGGTGPYTYSWNNSQTTSGISGLSAGTYTCYITDANGCTLSQTVTITQPPVITASATSTNTTCGNTNGTATATASGGTGTLTYSWAPSGGSSANATGLGAGTYTVYVTDANGCTQTANATVSNSNGPNVTLSNQTNLNCATSANGTATVSVTGGTSPYTYSWTSSSATGATATGLNGGTYTVTITDANGCTTTQVVTITAPPPITANASSTNASCGNNDGTATVTASGGTGTLTYSWLPSGASSATITGLAVGNYSVIITDANGCTQTAMTSVVNGNGPTATVGPNVTITGGGSTNLTATGGGTYSWSPSSGLSCITCANPVASPVSTTQYCVTVTDVNGCTDMACMTVTVDIPCPSNADFSVPNAFSPNGDGHNDVFSIQGWKDCLVDFRMVIYDRWGEKVYDSIEITNGWDGTYKGKLMDPAVFVYYITAKLANGTEITKRGNISLVK